jgi:hypothetical protein
MAKCEICELLSGACVLGAFQQLEKMMWLDRAMRFGGDVAEAEAAAIKAAEEMHGAWCNLQQHGSEHHKN